MALQMQQLNVDFLHVWKKNKKRLEAQKGAQATLLCIGQAFEMNWLLYAHSATMRKNIEWLWMLLSFVFFIFSVYSRGDDYKSHLKCISEDQKYGGKAFDAKANKGDVKQQQWIQVYITATDWQW